MSTARTMAPPLLAAALVTGAACSDDDPASVGAGPSEVTAVDEEQPGDLFPDVLAVEPTFDGRSWSFAVTLSSPYDTAERYADGWRVIGPDGTVYGEHTLAHDHATEQPFTRRQTGVEIPADVPSVVVEGRDQVSGYGGDTITVDLEEIREESERDG